MCGSRGFPKTSNTEILNQLVESIGHRGPGGDGFVSDGRVILGITRLSIIDFGSSKLPRELGMIVGCLGRCRVLVGLYSNSKFSSFLVIGSVDRCSLRS